VFPEGTPQDASCGGEQNTDQLPLDGAFLRRIDLGGLLRDFAEEKSFDVVEEERLRVWIGEIEAVVIDDLRLFLQPPAPARLTNLGADSLSERVGKRSVSERGAFLAAMCAFDHICHSCTPR